MIEDGVSFYSTSIFFRGFMATCIAVLTLHFLAEVTVSRASFIPVPSEGFFIRRARSTMRA